MAWLVGLLGAERTSRAELLVLSGSRVLSKAEALKPSPRQERRGAIPDRVDTLGGCPHHRAKLLLEYLLEAAAFRVDQDPPLSSRVLRELSASEILAELTRPAHFPKGASRTASAVTRQPSRRSSTEATSQTGRSTKSEASGIRPSGPNWIAATDGVRTLKKTFSHSSTGAMRGQSRKKTSQSGVRSV